MVLFLCKCNQNGFCSFPLFGTLKLIIILNDLSSNLFFLPFFCLFLFKFIKSSQRRMSTNLTHYWPAFYFFIYFYLIIILYEYSEYQPLILYTRLWAMEWKVRMFWALVVEVVHP